MQPSGKFPHDFQHPFWMTVRMVLDALSGRRWGTSLTEAEIKAALVRKGTSAAQAFLDYLNENPALLKDVDVYLDERIAAVNLMLNNLLRTEAEALSHLKTVTPGIAVATYGTQMGHHQSTKVMVATTTFFAEQEATNAGVTLEPNPQARASVFTKKGMWVTPRRLDGALPALQNPLAVWEIKEYWGKTSGGSKMSDAIYECQLVGTELRLFEKQTGIDRVGHYLILDGKEQWTARKSDLGRAYDLLSSGIVDELIVGREVLTVWPQIVAREAQRVP